MTPRTWAEKKAAKLFGECVYPIYADAYAHALTAEHQRAVRIVKGVRAALKKSRATDRDANFYRAGAIQACNDILAALERGRT